MTISFVSSGPGNPDLLTVLAVKRISDADIIFYDDLSAGEILNPVSYTHLTLPTKRIV